MATFKYIIEENITLSNQVYKTMISKEIDSIDQFYRRVTTCTSGSKTTILNVGSNNHANDDGCLAHQDVKYIRITNLEDTNSCEVGVVGFATNYQFFLKAGESHIIPSTDNVMLAEEDTSPSFGTMADIDKVIVKPESGDVNVEIVAVSV